MQKQLNSITTNLESLVRHRESSQVLEQLFDGRNWEELKRVTETHFELFSIEEDRDRLKWLVLRLTTRLKMKWAKCPNYSK